MDSNHHISALQRQPCLLKTNSTRVLVTWLITLRLIICPSLYKARPDNLICKLSFRSAIFPQQSNARPNFKTSNVVGGAKFGWYPGYIYSLKRRKLVGLLNREKFRCQLWRGLVN